MEPFESVLAAHAARYPRMEPQDYGKLAFQSEFGPEHLLGDPAGLAGRIRREIPRAGPAPAPEDTGGGLCRLHLDGSWPDRAAPLLARLMALTAEKTHGTAAGLENKLAPLERLNVPGMGEWLERWRGSGCPPVRHSGSFRAAYAPHYRLVRREYGGFFPVLLEIAALLERGRAVIAVDGRCGSGKTGLADLLERLFPCRVFHMDDFYLPPDRRAPNWREIPAGNMDLERFRREALLPARAGRPAEYRAFDCRRGEYRSGAQLPPMPLTVAEGSYALHPRLRSCYDRTVFLTCSPEEQARRLRAREGERFAAFESLWIPLEERYCRAFDVEAAADFVVDTTVFF